MQAVDELDASATSEPKEKERVARTEGCQTDHSHWLWG